MKIYLIRHGEASHLKENWTSKRIGRKEFITKMIEWENVDLTPEGRKQAEKTAKKLPSTNYHLFSSPLPRAKQTAELLNIHNKKIYFVHDLKEIVTSPPKLFGLNKFSINFWIYLCIFMCFFNGFVFRVIKKTLNLFDLFFNEDRDLVIVSHSMRIRSFVYLAYFCPSLKVITKDFSTCGISIIAKKPVKEKAGELVAVSG